MKKTFIPLVLTVLIGLVGCMQQGSKYQVDQVYNGFKLIEKRFVKEVNAECLYFMHEKSGARLFKVAADDPNKLFNIAFKTVPEHDYGTPHIMEHSVLNGSTNFPVKSPFDVLTKGSLNTFLNAMTGSDITTYPVASMNDKDYFNLMHVYLDAVFNTRIYDDPRILQQEGWHHEMDDVNGEVVYKGVVYNEMKGAFSSPTRELDYQASKILFPDNTYGVSSGGYPTEIPKLTYEYFINFHKKFYHPSNSYILLYGDANLDKEMAFINEQYLINYDKSDKKVEIPLQKPFDAMKVAEKSYPVPVGADTEDKSYLSLNFVIGQSTDVDLCLAFNVITEALVEHESAPVRLALQEAGIGKDVSCYFAESKQNIMEIQVQNANPEDQARFKEVVFSTIKKVISEGFDKETLEGIINRMEFRMREGDTPQKGIMIAFSNYQGWFFADDPFLGLEYEAPLAHVKESLTSNMLEELCQKHILDNPHALLITLKPEPGLQDKIDAKVNQELADYKASLAIDDKQKLVDDTKALIAYQKEEDSPEALATIPMLTLADISPEVEWYPIEEKQAESVPVLHYNEFSSNILYSKLYFDLSALPQDLIPYAKLQTALLGKLNTASYTYGELDNQLNIHTGGFHTSLNNYIEENNIHQMTPKYAVTAKATEAKSEKMFELITEILTTTKYDDEERLKSLLTRHQAGTESYIKNRGINVALTRLGSYYSPAGVYNEMTSGLDYYQFITELTDNYDANKEEIIEKLQMTAELLFNRNNLTAAVTCSEANYPAFINGLEGFTAQLSDMPLKQASWKFEPVAKNEGLKSSSKVQYVVKGYNFKELGYDYNGKMRVLNQILSRDYLQTQIRVVGGAYGGFSGFSATGNVYFASYRDPNLTETLENYDATPDFLNEFSADDTEMTRFIIGTISRLDGPMTVSQKGNTAFSRYFSKTSLEELKAERTAILSTSAEDIKGMNKMVNDVLTKDIYCVYGSDTKIEENKDIFNSIMQVVK
ncbi:insulinase family protein [Carboxylicivirga marina]|uniref:Insulinase family protein n=1 Tax=Carboxylicivirga marina TaxID=2800988 RepID=A0ABS1HPU2_9BACT|nr:insulinase family protein [Carboxylicivirga marina]MBK3519661.1 insulinase family protein [Carboxylicivirga marina]